MTNGNEKASPEIQTAVQVYNGVDVYGDTFSLGGLTKREHFAAMAMQSFIAAEPDRLISKTVKDAVGAADALIEALNK